MCVVFWKEKGDCSIPYVAEVLRYDLAAREVRVTLAVAVSLDGEEGAVVGALHRRRVDAKGSMDRWYERPGGRKDPVVQMLEGLYAGGLDIGDDQEVTLGPTLQDNEKIGVFHLASPDAAVEIIDPYKRYADRAIKPVRVEEDRVPFTPFRFGPLEGRRDWLYSFDLTLRGATFETLVGGREHCSVDGASVLMRSVLHEDLAGFAETDPWCRLFNESVVPNIVRPARYDVIITNGVGRLPACYRLCARTRRQYVADPVLREKVAWFSSDDPDQDFVIEVDLEDSLPDARKLVAARHC
jgi:hypothetical protein